MNTESILASRLLQINAIKLSPQKPFQWASGLYSPIYCDNRIALSFPEVRDEITERFINLFGNFTQADLIAGVATSGIAFGALVAHRMKLPFVYVRAKPKAHGRQNKIEGFLKAGQKCIVIEDLISTGGSALKAVEALREEGAHVLFVAAVFSYMLDSGFKNFAQQKCSYKSLSNYSALVDFAAQTGKFNPTELDLLQKWREDPEKWSTSHSKHNP